MWWTLRTFNNIMLCIRYNIRFRNTSFLERAVWRLSLEAKCSADGSSVPLLRLFSSVAWQVNLEYVTVFSLLWLNILSGFLIKAENSCVLCNI